MHGSKRLPKARSSGYSKRCPAGLGAMTVLSVVFLWAPCRLTRRRKRNAPASLQRSANKLRWGRPAHKLAQPLFLPYLDGMEVHFNPDLQARLTQRAAQQGHNLDETVQDVVARYFEEEDRFVEAVKRGEAALERGEFLTHEQVGDRLKRFLQP